ncbi:MAG: hypothetical protein LBJ02_04935 [Bifidobacteriaceae bacterium]|jgi:hypothetical protein|nr:hypothetical protein [Bifidobacteriaceae bacterium]
MTTTTTGTPAGLAAGLTAGELNRFVDAAQNVLPAQAKWTQLATYPGSLAECIIDALWSERVKFTTVIRIVERYRTFRRWVGADGDQDGAPELVRTFNIGLDAWMDQIGNHQRAYSRDDAPYKAELVLRGGQAAVAALVETTAQLRDGYARKSQPFLDFHRMWLELPSQHSGLTWERLLLVSGIRTVPPDLWLAEFASGATGQAVSNQDALTLVEQAAQIMGTTPLRLRNAIWQYQTKLDRADGTSPAGSHRSAPGAPANEETQDT